MYRRSRLEKLLFNPPPLGCVLYLPGVPGGGGTLHDRSPYGNKGAITGAPWAKLVGGLWGLSFDGVDDEVDCGNNGSLDLVDGASILLWLNPSGSNASYATVISKGSSYGVERVTSDILRLYLTIDGDYRYSATIAYTAGSWACFGFSYSASSKALLVYKNGVLQSTVTLSGLTTYSITANATSLKLGSYASSNYWKGHIAFPRLFNKVLSSLEFANSFSREERLFGVW